MLQNFPTIEAKAKTPLERRLKTVGERSWSCEPFLPLITASAFPGSPSRCAPTGTVVCPPREGHATKVPLPWLLPGRSEPCALPSAHSGLPGPRRCVSGGQLARAAAGTAARPPVNNPRGCWLTHPAGTRGILGDTLPPAPCSQRERQREPLRICRGGLWDAGPFYYPLLHPYPSIK